MTRSSETDSPVTLDGMDADHATSMEMPVNGFSELGLGTAILERLEGLEFRTPTPIQAKAIPTILEGRDILGLAQTGTGKTAAYLLPLIQQIVETREEVKVRRTAVLILAPTRELAHQISASIKDFASGEAIRYLTICGGERYDWQFKALKKGVDVIVATPGRFEDLQAKGVVDLTHVRHLILDEADQMIDMGFHPAMERICASLPDDRQTIFFSATMPPEMKSLADKFLTDGVTISIKREFETADTVNQRAIMVNTSQKRDVLLDLLDEIGDEQVLMFTNTRRRAEEMMQYLMAAGIQSDQLHGDMRQQIRLKVIRKFKTGQLQVLVATDVAARGIDVVGLNWVINYDLPRMPETYVHRIGRTGRAGQTGQALSLFTPADVGLLRNIEKHIRTSVLVTNSRGEEVDLAEHAATPARGPKKFRSSGKGGRPFGKSGGRPSGKAGSKPSGKPSGKSDAKPFGKSASKPAYKPTGKPGGNPAGKSFDKSGGKSGGKPSHFADGGRDQDTRSDRAPSKQGWAKKKHQSRDRDHDWARSEDRPPRQFDSDRPAKGKFSGNRKSRRDDRAFEAAPSYDGGERLSLPREARHKGKSERRDDHRGHKRNDRRNDPRDDRRDKRNASRDFEKPFSKQNASGDFNGGDHKRGDKKPFGKPGGSKGGKPFGKTGGKPGGKLGGKPGGKPFGKSGGKSGGRPVAKGGHSRPSRSNWHG